MSAARRARRLEGSKASDLSPGSAAFEDRLKEFAERLGAITDRRQPIGFDWPDDDDDTSVAVSSGLPTPVRGGSVDDSGTIETPTAPVDVADSSPTTGRLAPEALAAYVQRLSLGTARAMRRVATRSDDAAIHDLRVHARRLVAVLRVWGEMFKRGLRKRATRDLRRLRRGLGEAREIEVHSDLLEAHARQWSAEQREVLGLALDQASRRLEPARRRAAQVVRDSEVADRVEALERATRRFPARHSDHPRVADDACRRVRRLEIDAITAVKAALAQTDDGVLHGARIALKKWRYAREALNAGLALSADLRLAAAREMQEELGIVQDRASLRRELVPDAAFTEAPDVLTPLLGAVEADRREAIERFRELAIRYCGGS